MRYLSARSHWPTGRFSGAEAPASTRVGRSLAARRADRRHAWREPTFQPRGLAERILSPSTLPSSPASGRDRASPVFEETLQPFMEVSTDVAPGYVLANHPRRPHARRPGGRVLIRQKRARFAMLEEMGPSAAAPVRGRTELDEASTRARRAPAPSNYGAQSTTGVGSRWRGSVSPRQSPRRQPGRAPIGAPRARPPPGQRPLGARGTLAHRRRDRAWPVRRRRDGAPGQPPSSARQAPALACAHDLQPAGRVAEAT
jgi:hypothetical protein